MLKLRKYRPSALAALIIVAVAVLAGIQLTAPNGSAPSASGSRRGVVPMARLVDQQPLQLSQQLDKLATTREEVRYSRQAVNLADHAVDLAFTTALRDAKNHPVAENAETKRLHDRVRELESRVAADRKYIAQMAGDRSADENVELAKAELALHENELDDARRDLIRAGGDTESRIQRLFNQHQAAQHAEAPQPYAPTTKPAFQVSETIAGQMKLWSDLRTKRQQLLDAQHQSLATVADLTSKHDQLEKQVGEAQESASISAPAEGATSRLQQAQKVTLVQSQAEDRKTLSDYDSRIQDMQQLAQVYGDWAGLITSQMRAAVHGMLQGALWIVLILIGVLLGNVVIDRLSRRFAEDRRRMATIRLIGRFVVQGTGLLLIIFVVVGSPSQLSTILALAGAGLTVALKDFIVAFFGWFVLMGKNGIRVGDWVEINGIVGEVVDIGVLRTVLLETGNWAESGHPTGRRVTFVNSFAIEGHYFNFSTAGQWLWDTLEILIPAGQDPYPLVDAVHTLVEKETAKTARVAEQEWQHATRDRGMQSFSATPAINLRPSSQGVTMVVRYITSASDRFDMRARLYQAAVELLHHRKHDRAPSQAKADAVPS